MDICTKNLENFVDLDRCQSLIEDLKTKLTDDVADNPRAQSEMERLDETFRRTIDKYQEQPELLEPYLADLIELLTSSLNSIRWSSKRYHTVFKFLYQLIKVTGFKSIVKKFPHETDKLPMLVDLLSREDPKDKINWQTRYVLTVWLSIVLLTPFDLVKFDSDSVEPMSSRIYSALSRSLAHHDSCQHVAAFCLAKYFSRPDVLKSDQQLSQFITSALQELSQVKIGFASSQDDVNVIGYLKTLAYMFKFLPRAELKRRSPAILETILKLDTEKINRELVNHLIIKLTQRVGLALLPKSSSTWRYKRGARILGGNKSTPAIDNKEEASLQQAAEQVKPASQHLVDSEDVEMSTEGQGETKEDVVGDEEAKSLESILSILLVAAQNTQTKIRWSAAKGLARLASRLSRERAGDVIDMLLENFFNKTTSSEFAWHGGCLALAEMSRNGLILEEKLPEVIGIMGDAIIYDKIKGSFAVGAHVREAACYVFWAMARTYEDNLLAPYINSISVNLLCTMLFDRELHCRRAASATFQELVGRQGTFSEEGISILTNVDYQSVGPRQSAYLELALQVAKHGPQYYEPFIKHLIEKKIGHWDVQIRRLACDSLCALMLHPSHEFIRSSVLPQLGEMCQQNTDNNLKHGAILALSKVIKSLVPLDFHFDQQIVEFAGSLVRLCDKQLKSKQQAPNFIEAICHVILSAEVARFNFSSPDQNSSSQPPELLKQWESLVLTALDSDKADLRDLGSEALLTLYRYFYKFQKGCQDRLLTILNRSLESPNESSRCGALRSLSKLSRAISSCSGGAGHSSIGDNQQQQQQGAPCFSTGGEIKLDADTPDIILMSLTSYIGKSTKEHPSGLIFAEAKAESCEAFVNFIKNLDKQRLILVSQWIRLGYEALLEKTEDYTFDKRGDIGVVVRRAAIKSLQELTLFLLSIGFGASGSQTTSLLLNNQRLTKIISRTLQQAVSYNNSAREQAALAFYRLIGSGLLPEGSVPHRQAIMDLFEKFKINDEFNWRDDSTPLFVNLLAKPEYSSDLWIGLMPAVGQVSDLCAKQFRDSLMEYLNSLGANDDGGVEQKRQVFESFLQTLEKPNLAQRLLTSGLITADYLLTQGLMSEISEEFQARLVAFCWTSRGIGSGGGNQADPKRLMSVGRVLCAMLQFRGPIQYECLKNCLTLLANGFSKVRAFMAEQLYLSLMTYQSDLEENLNNLQLGAQDSEENNSTTVASNFSTSPISTISKYSGTTGSNISADSAQPDTTDAANKKIELNLEAAMDLLSQTNWSEPLEQVKPVRDRICSCLLVNSNKI